MLTKKKILLFADWYEPGFRAGGPIRSVVNFVQNMKEDYAIYVFTADRDLDASQSYENISKNEWIATAPDVQCYYCSPENRTRANIRQQLNAILPDFIYLNSMFSTRSTIIPLLVARMDRQEIFWSGCHADAAVEFPGAINRFTATDSKETWYTGCSFCRKNPSH